MDLFDIQTFACGALEWFQQALIRLCVCAAVALFVVLVLRTQTVRDAAARIAALWREASHFMRLAVLTLLSVCIIDAGEKMRICGGALGDRAPSVTAEEIAQGWRLESVVTNDAVSYALPTNGVEYMPWSLGGGYEAHFPLDLGEFAFPFGTNVVRRVDVVSGGMVESLPRPSCMSICAAREYASIVPGVGRFWWAETARPESAPYRGKVLTWENVYAGRDRTGLYNAQIEFHDDGNFITRSNDVERIYRRVEPFDWDGDGLENTVDPDPLVAGADAHGTNAEWYNVVCSNVLEAVEGDGGGVTPVLTWLDGVNSNAYYFVDVVTTNGLAPIYFTGDRESRLGNPVVVARGGETNHVPLLIGINYAVTSPMPFTVSIPEDGFASVTTNGVSNYEVQWQLEFTVAPDGTGYRVSAGPYDPGCVFQWAEPTRSLACSYTTDGGWIGFSCCGIGACGCSGCVVAGVATLEYASFDLPNVWCGCWHFDPLEPGYGMFQTNTPSVSISFDKAVVFYEDAYTNAPNDVVAKHSTNTTLTVFACGGESGGMLYVTAQNISKLARVGGSEIDFPYVAFVPPHGCVSFSVTYTAETHSDSEGDIFVSAAIFPHEGDVVSDSASVTAVKVLLEARYGAPANGNKLRHMYGVREEVFCKHLPEALPVLWSSSYGDFKDTGNAVAVFTAPMNGCECTLAISANYENYMMKCSILEPEKFYCERVSKIDFGLGTNIAGGVGMSLELYIKPLTVSFGNIALQEVPTGTGQVWGYFLNNDFSHMWAHTRDNRAGQWNNVGGDNLFMLNDEASLEGDLPRVTPDGTLTNDISFGWTNGGIVWSIPLGWHDRNRDEEDSPARTNAVPEQQKFVINQNGAVGVVKAGHYVLRGTNTQITTGRVLE